jgi:hypothetical protein
MATASSSPANSAEKVTGPVRVVMPDQTGSFQLNVPRGAVQHVQVVDVDMVLHMADGTKVVLAGGAMEAMDDKSKVKFSDTTPATGSLLDSVGKIPLAPNDQSRVLNSDPVAAAERIASSDAPASQQHVTVDRNSASVGSDGVSQLAKIISDNAGSLTTNGTQQLSIPTQPTAGDASSTTVAASIAASQNSNDTPTKTIEPQAPPERPGVIPPTVVVDPSAPTQAIKLVNVATVTQVGSTLFGSAGVPISATDASLPQQFSTQVINAGNDVTTIYATGNNTGAFTKVFDLNITGTGNVLSVIVSGVPANMSVVNGTSLGGGKYQISVAAGQKDFGIQLQYQTVEADSSAPVHQAFDLGFTTVVATSNGQLTLNDTRHVAVKDASAYGDLNYLDPATGDAVLVLPAQGAPHEVHAGNNAGTTIYGSNANDLLYGGTGNDILYGGTGNTFFEGGAGADQLIGGVNSTGTNVNTASYANSGAGVTVNLVTGAGTGGDAQGDTLSNIQNLKGSAYNDTFVASAAVNRLDGGSGGSDTVSYESSTAAVTVNLVTGTGTGGYAQGDTYTHIQNATGSNYDDVFIASTDANRFDGGGGSNTVSYATSSAGVTVNLQTGVGSGGAAAGDTYVRIQNVVGTAYNDTFVGSNDANSFDGGSGGNDTVSYAGSTAGVSVNFVSGRGTGGYAEGDTYNHIQNAIGSAYDDVFIAGVDSQHFDGGSGGSDTVNYGASTGAVTVNMITLTGSGGYAQNNSYTNIQNIVGSSYSDTFIASAAANNFNGGLGGSDTVSYAFSTAPVTVDLFHGTASGGYAQGDMLAHIQNVIGSDYDDTFIASADVNNFSGGAGSNTVSYLYSTGGVTVDLTNAIGTGTGGFYAAGDSFTNIQNLIGSVYDDTFVASADANTLDGGAGSLHNRVSYAVSTAAVTVDLNYTDGTGTSGGYATGDKLANIQDLTGSAYDDTFVASAADNNFDGGAGSNRVSYASSTAAVTVDLVLGTGSGGYAANDTYTNIQNVTGSNFDDTFIASLAGNAFDGGGGTNTVSYAKASDGNGVTVDLFNHVGSNGFAAGDTYANIQNVIGTAYDDTFIADNNHNVFTGLQGSDTVSYANSTAGVTVNLVSGAGTGGFADGDTYSGIENVIGSASDDLFIASTDANAIDGGVSTATSHNRVSYASSDAAVTVDLNYTDGTGTSGGYAAGDKLSNIQDLTGSSYDDTFVANAASNNFDGGASTATSHNRVSYASSTAAVTVDLNYTDGTGTSGGYAQGDTFTNVQDLTGSSSDDVFVASAAANYLDGGTSTASSHNRVSYASSTAAVTVDLNYTDGTGTSGGYAAGDKLSNIQDLTGSSYDDTFVASAASNNFDGGTSTASSHNRVSYASSTAAVTVDLNYTDGTGTSGGYAQGDKLTNIQDLTGSSYDDVFVASAASNYFDGGTSTASSHNRVSYASSTAAVTVDLNYTNGTGTSGGYAQGDTFINVQDLTGSSYDDIFVASAAANYLDGGTSTATSHNRVSYASSTAAVTVDLNYTDGTGTSGGYAAGDKLSNIQDLTGSSYDDTFVASAASNYFDGGTSTATSHNRVSYASSTAAVTVDLNYTDGTGTSGGYAASDKLSNIQDLTGSSYDDTFVANNAANYLDGGTSTASSHNRVSYASSTAAVTVDLNYTDGTGTSGGYAAGDKLSNIQDLTGSSYDDVFVASAASNYFDGGTSTASSHNRVSYAASNAGVTVDLNYTNGTGTSGGYAQNDRLTNIQDLTGSAYDDTFVASNAANNLDGAAGSNTVSYSGSNAAVTVDLSTSAAGIGGYAAGDTYTNIQNVIGSAYADTLTGFATVGVKSTLTGGAGGDTLTGVQANRAYTYASYAGSGSGVTVDLNFTDGTGTSGGDAAGDKLSFIDNLIGSSSNDIFVANSQANSLDGAAGSDTVSYARSTSAVTVDLSTAIGTGSGGYAAGDTYVNIENVIGSAFNDTLTGFATVGVKSTLTGGAGADALIGVAANSANTYASYAGSSAGVTVDLFYTDGTGTSGGDAAGDTLININNLVGSDYNDTFYANSQGNSFDGGLGTNTVNYSHSNAAVTVDLSSTTGSGTSGGYAAGDKFANIQNVVGSDFNDVFYASNQANFFDGGLGNNTVNYARSTSGVTVDLYHNTGANGYAAGDTYANIQNATGSSSNDTFVGNSAANSFVGGGGSDTVSYEYSTGSAIVASLASNTGTSGDAASDTYSGIANLTGSAFVDSTLTGDANGNILTAKGSGTTNSLTGGGAGSGQTDIFNIQDGGTNSVTVGSGANTVNVSAGANSTAGAQDAMVNKTTGTANINMVNGGAGTTTLHFEDLGNSLDLSKIAAHAHGITTLDISAGTSTNVLLSANDIITMGVSNVMTIKLTGNESLQIASSDFYRIFANGDYVFYSNNTYSAEVARIHILAV